tara:strand:- start:174 stop:329 length:156 start_codon:yes stop_codon:yes gene_type:complete
LTKFSSVADPVATFSESLEGEAGRASAAALPEALEGKRVSEAMAMMINQVS